MASPKYVYPWRGRHPWSMTWRNNWKTVETRSLDRKHPEGGKQKELEETFASPSASLCTNMQVRVMTQLLFEAFNT